MEASQWSAQRRAADDAGGGWLAQARQRAWASQQAAAPQAPQRLGGAGVGDGKQAQPRLDASGALGAPDAPPAPAAPRDASQLDAARGWDVKIGLGGIREIEFFAQALQLVHCGQRPALRVRHTLDALDRLLYAGLISREDQEALSDAYDFFRRLEHRVQMEHDRQSHRLPEDDASFARLATRIGLDASGLREAVITHRRAVSARFERLFNTSPQRADEPTVARAQVSALDVALTAPHARLMDAPVQQALREAGFTRPRQVASQLQILAQKDYGPYGTRLTPAQRQLGRYLLEVCAGAVDPDQAFGFVTRLITSVGDRGWFWGMLADNPHATRLLVDVFGASEVLGRMLLRDPNVIQRLLGAGSARLEVGVEELEQQLQTRWDGLSDPEHRRGRLHRMHREELLRLSLYESAGSLSIESTTRQLGALAEVTLRGALAEVYAMLSADRPQWPALDALPFSVIGMGKLGGMELGFGSDLDLVFVYEVMPELGLDHSAYARLAQRLVRALSTLSEEGRLYEVDMRLRPSGQKGALVVSLDAFDAYHRDAASLWERQALLRARPLTGSPALRARFMALRQRAVFEAPWPSDGSSQIHTMRERMRASLTPPGAWDVKHGEGGLIDLEFLVQAAQLSVARKLAAPAPEAMTLELGARAQHTAEALRGLSAQRAFTRRIGGAQVARGLEEAWRVWRRLEARLHLYGKPGQGSQLPDDAHARRALARQMGFHGDDATAQLEDTIARMRAIVHDAYARWFDASAEPTL